MLISTKMVQKQPAINYFFQETQNHKPEVMVSACLLGEAVRYDGKDKRFKWISYLAEQLQLISCCPEVGAGLGIPRPPVQLVQIGNHRQALGRDNPELDVTSALQTFAKQHSNSHNQLCGYLLKSRSPSCGLGSTPLFNQRGQQIGTGNGIQANAFLQAKPWLAYRQETDLNNQENCDDFIEHCKVVYEILRCKPEQQASLMAHYQQQGLAENQLMQLASAWEAID